ncbi:MAG: hypothetical protein II865_04365 [Bacteroidales bacterium]|nr:hypothetical protein [Bacteroidales bacterium]
MDKNLRNLLKLILLPLLLTVCLTAVSQVQDTLTQKGDSTVTNRYRFTKKDYIPKFTATVLGRYEYNTNLNAHHFELRHTRVGVYGSVHPMFSYMALVDLSFGGKFSPVAIFAQFKPVKGLSFLIGYDKMPFSNENLLSPYQYYFSDKSFLTQKITAWSDVGGVVAYKWDKVVPFEIKAGVFNSRGFSRQMQFQKELNYVARGSFKFFKGFELTVNYAAVRPEELRMHNLGLGLAYDIANLHLESEYIYKWYADAGFQPTHALYGFAYYKIGVNKKWLEHVDVAARYDAITPNCDGRLLENDRYFVEPFRQRITAGLTLMFIEKPVRAGIRVNYEKNFFRKGVINGEDRVILELITHY